VEILGIVNITRDSFSDGGRYLRVDQAIAHARQLVCDGAAIIDLGAESTHPDAEDVPAEEEITRLTPVVRALLADGVQVSVDTHKPLVMRAMLELGVHMINDVTALRDPEAVAAVRDWPVRVVLMHSTSPGPRAQRAEVEPVGLVERIVTYFRTRIAELEAAGIARQRLILDPGMGFFLGRDPRLSLTVLLNLDRIAALGLPVCVSTSRKSFIGTLLGTPDAPAPVDRRGSGTLATELWAYLHGAQYVRTHDVRALHDAIRLWRAIEQADHADCAPPRPGRPADGGGGRQTPTCIPEERS